MDSTRIDQIAAAFDDPRVEAVLEDNDITPAELLVLFELAKANSFHVPRPGGVRIHYPNGRTDLLTTYQFQNLDIEVMAQIRAEALTPAEYADALNEQNTDRESEKDDT